MIHVIQERFLSSQPLKNPNGKWYILGMDDHVHQEADLILTLMSGYDYHRKHLKHHNAPNEDEQLVEKDNEYTNSIISYPQLYSSMPP